MSFTRAFSTRRKEHEPEISGPMMLGRAASQRGGKPVHRAQISSPKALLSTSNPHIHNTHSIVGVTPIDIRHVSSGSATSSSDESEGNWSVQSHDTVTDASSIDDSPIRCEPEPNHLTSYFKPSVDTHSRTTSTTSQSLSARQSTESTPRLPQRAPSHSKKAHEGLHRKRSIQRMLSPPPSREPSTHEVSRTSAEMFVPQRGGFVEAPRENPFGKELAQLEEVAEEFGQVVRNAEKDADAVYMEAHGLAHFSASEYMSEIQSLIHEMFREEQSEYDFGGFF